MRVAPSVNRPKSVRYLLSAVSRQPSAVTTVVSARNHPDINRVRLPHRVVILINVDGFGARSPSGIRQNRNHANESGTSAQTIS